MPEMIATSEIEYPPGKFWKPGDRFEVEEPHVLLLQKLGRAQLEADQQQVEEAAPRGRARTPRAR
jgi:hypothetical protein